MNIIQEFRDRPQQVLDRLVDGELGVEERRTLLAALDDEPGAWRQCALAFLEAQTWGWQLSRVASEPLLAKLTSKHVAMEPRPTGHRLSLVWPFSLAACVLVAFLLGGRLADRATEVPVMADSATHKGSDQGGAAQSVDTNTQGDRNSDSSDVAEHPAALVGNSEPGVANAPESALDPSGPTTLTLRSPSGEESIELPVLEADDSAVETAAGRSLAVSGALLKLFEQDGFQVDRQQQMLPVELPDGRRVLVPIEEFSIQSPEIERL